jgi:hypothetical protein
MCKIAHFFSLRPMAKGIELQKTSFSNCNIFSTPMAKYVELQKMYFESFLFVAMGYRFI